MGSGLALLGGLITLYATIKVIIDANESEGFLHAVLCFFCGLYAMYWLIFRYEDNDKIVLIICAVVGIVLSVVGRTANL